MATNVIHVQWKGPLTWEEVKGPKGPTDYGLYQIVGRHPIYGSYVLLYIGLADGQTFGQRIPEHYSESQFRRNDVENMRIFVGRLEKSERKRQLTDDDWSRQIEFAEKLLIFAHSPAFNSQQIKEINSDQLADVHILNWDSYGCLLPEVSGNRWTDKHWVGDWYPYESKS